MVLELALQNKNGLKILNPKMVSKISKEAGASKEGEGGGGGVGVVWENLPFPLRTRLS